MKSALGVGRYVPLVLGLLSFAHPLAVAQDEPDEPLAALFGENVLVRFVLSEVEDILDRTIDSAADRLDLSLMRAALEAAALVNQVSTQFADNLDQSVDQLDGQQRRMVSDIASLIRTLEGAAASTMVDPVEKIRQDTRLLLDRDPGFISIASAYAVEGDTSLAVDLRGTALSQASFRVEVAVDGESQSVASNTTRMEDARIRFEIPLTTGPAAHLLDSQAADDLPQTIPITFTLEDCMLLGFFCEERRFAVLGYVLPRHFGTIRAVFAGDVERREERQTSRTGTTRWIRSSLKSRELDEVFPFRADDGWRIDVDSIRHTISFDHRECWSGRSYTQLLDPTEHRMRVRVHFATENGPFKKCRAKVTVEFRQWMPGSDIDDIETDSKQLLIGEDAILELPDDAGIKNARFLHAILESRVFGEKTHYLRHGDEAGGFGVEYDPVGQIVYVRAQDPR